MTKKQTPATSAAREVRLRKAVVKLRRAVGELLSAIETVKTGRRQVAGKRKWK
jgi:hypothetical protein